MTWLLSCAEHRDAQTEDHIEVQITIHRWVCSFISNESLTFFLLSLVFAFSLKMKLRSKKTNITGITEIQTTYTVKQNTLMQICMLQILLDVSNKGAR